MRLLTTEIASHSTDPKRSLGVSTIDNLPNEKSSDPALRSRLDPDEAAERVYNFLHTLTIEAQLFARACGKTNLHSLEPEDLAALTMEASAMAGVPLAGTNHTVGIDDYHHF